jgi:osmotically-inducible protein OsmY
MKRLLSLAALAGAGYLAYRYYQQQARPEERRVPEMPSDTLLSQRVQVSLQRSGVVPSDTLQVRVVEGEVVPTGSVTASERDRVLRAILAVPGIRGVRNQLEVRGAPRDPDLVVPSG